MDTELIKWLISLAGLAIILVMLVRKDKKEKNKYFLYITEKNYLRLSKGLKLSFILPKEVHEKIDSFKIIGVVEGEKLLIGLRIVSCEENGVLTVCMDE